MNEKASSPLAYCGGGAETFDRLLRLHERRDPEIVVAQFQVPSETVKRFAATHPGGYCPYPDPRERIRFWDDYLRERAAVRDDSVPAAYPSELDQGLYAGLVGGEVRFLCDPSTGWVSSMVPPLFGEISEVGDLRRQSSASWWSQYLRYLEVFSAEAAGSFGISHFILIDGLNFAFEMIGATQTYMAMIEDPQPLRGLADFALELNVRVQKAFFERVGLVAGGTCSNMAGWVPGRVLNESLDPFHMTSVADFEKWGRQPVERIFRRFDGGVLHLHGNGRHLLEAAASLKGLKAIQLGDDKGWPAAFDVLPELKARAGGLPLAVGVGFEKFLRAIRSHRLLGGVQYVVTGTPSIDEANRAMDKVRAYRP